MQDKRKKVAVSAGHLGIGTSSKCIDALSPLRTALGQA